MIPSLVVYCDSDLLEQMIEQALTVLNLHIIWKARGLSTDAEPSADEIKYRESLRDQRDVLLEKLVEYAVGAQSNTAEGVKRMVRLSYFTTSQR